MRTKSHGDEGFLDIAAWHLPPLQLVWLACCTVQYQHSPDGQSCGSLMRSLDAQPLLQLHKKNFRETLGPRQNCRHSGIPTNLNTHLCKLRKTLR
jgi:hypothetical protein